MDTISFFLRRGIQGYSNSRNHCICRILSVSLFLFLFPNCRCYNDLIRTVDWAISRKPLSPRAKSINMEASPCFQCFQITKYRRNEHEADYISLTRRPAYLYACCLLQSAYRTIRSAGIAPGFLESCGNVGQQYAAGSHTGERTLFSNGYFRHRVQPVRHGLAGHSV